MDFPGDRVLEGASAEDRRDGPATPDRGGDLTRMLVLKCLSDQTGDSAEEIAAAGYVEGDDRDYVEAVNRLESYFDCTLGLLGADGRRIVVEDVIARIPAGSGALAGGHD
ncbi:hypothetical protein A6A06_14110 [Streptomyces sp. CB02923]|uniref:DUF6137 domain-containing protein n=1 Tax=Streptomyces sp. CB02923 TaxID=1718985 RepID=UPI00093AA61A|nr:DUF6137 domain-containing protein [Streptomyces sp. CB02923]OKI02202.1 hypothetical protein A6A06_14110 [Streptomyces sp. CB02923]